MFKRMKAFILIASVFTLLVGSGPLVSQAAAVEGKGNEPQTTYKLKSDPNFQSFYQQLMKAWEQAYPKKLEQKGKAPHKTQGKRPVEAEVKEPVVEEGQEASPPTEATQQEKIDSLNAFENEMFQLTNQERVKHGLKPFQIDLELSRVAREKSRDMAANRYFAHQSPVYGSPFDMMRAYGITYRTAGENIAKGQVSPEEVVKAWMNSPGHRANILNPNFTHIGVGFVESGNHWTQQFIGK